MDNNGGIDPSMGPRLDTLAQQPIQPGDIQVPLSAPDLNQMPAPAMPPSFNDPMQMQQPMMDMPIADPGPDLVVPPVNTSGGGVVKKILFVVLGLVVVVGLLGGGYFAGLSSGKTQGKNEATAAFQAELAKQQESKKESTDKNAKETPVDTELKLGDLQDPQYKDETVEGQIGKPVTAGDGFVLEVTKLERNFKVDDPNYKLDDGSELVKVDFLMGNIGKDNPKTISNFNFRLENSTDAQLVPETIDKYDGKFDTTTLKPGAQAKGSIVYKVNKDEKPLKFTRTQVYRLTNQNREVTTKISISVAS